MTAKTKPRLCAKDKLRLYWDRKERCLGGWHPLGSQTQCDLAWLFGDVMTPAVLAEFKRRGYDPATLRMSIEPLAGNDRFASQRPKP